MAKTPANSKTAIAVTPVTQKVMGRVDNLEMGDFDISNRAGVTTVKGFSHKHNKHVRFVEYEANGIKQQSVTMVGDMTIEQRIFESKRLTAAGHTQQEIADMLGVSQKTISNDLQK